jgi:hypothetical protein
MKNLIFALTLIASVGFPKTVRAFPIGYPYSFWGEVYNDGHKTVAQSYFEQGAEIFRVADDKLVGTAFVGLGLNKSSVPENSWENQIVPAVGFKLSYPFQISSGGWGTVSVGVRHKWYDYFGHTAEDHQVTEVFMGIGFGGDWKAAKY